MNNSVHQLPGVTPDHLKALQLWEASGAAEAMREDAAKRKREKQAELAAQLAAIEHDRVAKLNALLKAEHDAKSELPTLLQKVNALQLTAWHAERERSSFENSTEMRMLRLKASIRELAPEELSEAIFEFRRLLMECHSGGLFRESVEVKRNMFGRTEFASNNVPQIMKRCASITGAIEQFERMQLDPEMTAATARERIKQLRDALPSTEIDGNA